MLNETHMMIVKPTNAQFDFNLQGYSNSMVFKTNNTERLRLTPTGTAEITGNMSVSGNVGFFGETPVSQQSTTGTTLGYTANSGSAVNFSTTFSGGSGTAYTIGDIVLALKNLGLLAS